MATGHISTNGNIPLVDLLVDKRCGVKEVHLIWFEQCNLNCSFCHQDHDSVVGMDSIVEHTLSAINRLDPSMEYKVNITGGELFHDGIPDNLFNDYHTAMRCVLDKLPRSTIYIGSNLVFTPDRLISLVDRLDGDGYSDRVNLVTSYDPAGRFTQRDLYVFLENLENPKIETRITTVNVVITKQNIDSILSGRYKDVLDNLYARFDLYFDHFMANDSYTLFQPSEEKIVSFFSYLRTHYPKSGPVDTMLRGDPAQLTCQSTIIFTDDNKMVTCWGEAGKDKTLDYDEGLVRKNEAENDFLEYYGCLSCEYYKRCTMRCFLHHRSLDERPTECQIKLFYDSLT